MPQSKAPLASTPQSPHSTAQAFSNVGLISRRLHRQRGMAVPKPVPEVLNCVGERCRACTLTCTLSINRCQRIAAVLIVRTGQLDRVFCEGTCACSHTCHTTYNARLHAQFTPHTCHTTHDAHGLGVLFRAGTCACSPTLCNLAAVSSSTAGTAPPYCYRTPCAALRGAMHAHATHAHSRLMAARAAAGTGCSGAVGCGRSTAWAGPCRSSTTGIR